MTKTQYAIARWFAEGEVGASSRCMASVVIRVKTDGSYPLDPDDLNRCLKLVKAAPGVKRHFHRIRKLGKEWRAVIDHWGELEKMFIEEAGLDWSKARSAPKTYHRMKALGL